MNSKKKTIFPLTALALLLFAISPLANASTLTVNLNPNTGLAELVSVSTTKITFTYPANSTASEFLRNVSSSSTLTGSFAGTASGAQELQGSFDQEDSHVSVKNMSVAFTYSAKGTDTSLTIDKSTNITSWVSGVFTVVNGTVTADLGWRAFVVRGALELPLEDHQVDINLAGSAVGDSFGLHAYAFGFLQTLAGGWWNRPTLNFSQLDTPLSTWTKNYDSATNTTTFSKTISGSSNFTATFSYNNQKYSLSAVSDPSGVVNVQGYANAQGDSLVMAPAPASTSGSLIAVGVGVAVVALAVGYLALRSRAKSKLATPSQATTPV